MTLAVRRKVRVTMRGSSAKGETVMLLRTRIAASIATLAVVLTAPAMADPPPGPSHDEGKPPKPGHHKKGESAEANDEGHGKPEHAGDKDKGEKKKDRADKDDHREGQGGGPPGLSAKDDERHKKLRERFEERRRSRGERAKTEREELRHKLGASLGSQAMQQELRRHAQTVARLERIKEIADADGKTELSARATAVLAKENARHEKRLAALAASAAPAPSASASGGAP